MNRITKIVGTATLSSVLALTMALPTLAEQVMLPQGKDIVLDFDQSLSDKTAKDGDPVTLHVDSDIIENGRTVIRQGTKVYGTITAVRKNERFGVNARIQMKLKPIVAVDGSHVIIGFKTKSASNGNTAGAAAASVGGAAILGPLGLIGGYFVAGKHVNVKPGDKMTVTVDRQVTINAH